MEDNKLLLDIVSRYYDTGTKKAKKDVKSVKVGIDQYNQAFTHLRESMKRAGLTSDKVQMGITGFKKTMEDNNVVVGAGGNFLDATSRKAMNWGKVTQKATKYSMKPFRGEFLSLMFIGMGVKKVFGGMLKTVLQTMGVFDVFRGVLMMILGPILMPLIAKWLPLLMKWLESDAHKAFAGKVILWGFALSSFVVILTQLGLLFMTWGGAMKFVKTIWSSLAAAIEIGGGGIIGGIKAIIPAIFKIVAPLMIVWGIFRALGGYLSGNWWKTMSGIVLAVGTVIALVMGGWIPALIAGVIAVLVKLGDRMDWIGTVARVIITAISAPFIYLYHIIKSIVDLLSGKISFGEAFKIGLGKGPVGTISSMVQGMQTGGIVTGPTLALLGENGPEAVVPLSGGGGGGGVGINYSPTININTGAGGIDVDAIASAVNERLYEDLRRVGIR